jgi:membrane fusion protein (multidrug efflux system)
MSLTSISSASHSQSSTLAGPARRSEFSLGAKRIALFLVFAAAAIVLAACGQGGAQQGGFGFPPAAVTLQTMAPTTVPQRFEYVGQTAGAKDAEVRARVTGILERRLYQEGGTVKAGQLMFVIDPRPYAAQAEQADAEVARAQAQAAQARRNLERLKPLLADNAISRREYDDAVSADEAAAANLRVAQARLTEAKLNLSYTQVTSPVTGYASRAQKSEGSLVSPGQESLLTTVSQLDPIHVNFSVSENDQLRLNRLIAEGKLVLPDSKNPNGYEVSVRLSDGSLFPRKGKVAFVDSRINPGTGSFDARAEVPNADASLRPGQFVRVILDGGKRPNVITVPQRAVLDSPQGKFVYVAGKSDKGADVALPRPVTVGDWVEIDGANQWIVESGLAAGDQVVIDGMAKLFPIPGGAPIALGPPPGALGADPAKGEVKKADAKK